MDQKRFWLLIGQARQESAGDAAQQLAHIADELLHMDQQDHQLFYSIYYAFHRRALSRRLWQALSIATEGASYEDFSLFVNWLILLGESTFCEITRSPGRAATVIGRQQWLWIASLALVADRVYDRKFGSSLVAWEELTDEYVEPILEGYDWLQPDDLNTIDFGPRAWAILQQAPDSVSES